MCVLLSAFSNLYTLKYNTSGCNIPNVPRRGCLGIVVVTGGRCSDAPRQHSKAAAGSERAYKKCAPRQGQKRQNAAVRAPKVRGPPTYPQSGQSKTRSETGGMLASFVVFALIEVSARKVPVRDSSGRCDGSEGRQAGRSGGGRGRGVRTRTPWRAERQTVREGEGP